MSPEELEALPPVARLTVRLCEIPSPSRQEAAVAEVVRGMLREMGAEVIEDGAATSLPAGCGNIIGRFPATAPGTPIMLASHLDTVPVTGPIEVELADGRLRNRHDAILGGDNKAAVAAMLEGMRRVVEEGRPHAGVELVFTPCEEIGLRGAHVFDPSPLLARFGFVYDHTGPVGDVVVAAPSLYRVTATFVGRAAHAGIAPEAGRSAILAAARAITRMPLGRIDAETTANVGTVGGGTATNVVAERCTVTAEARSRDERALGIQLTAMLDALTWAASECEVDLETHVEREFSAYRLGEGDPQVRMALDVLAGLGHEPRLVQSGGGSDVNAFLLNGFPAVNLCNGMTDVHTPDESIAVESLEAMLDVTLGLVDAARGAA
ncbi:M20/M25/M40 family metallo-hydrolase [Miltoncostaea marina]|uniref:M20/M25/M40 family metallo-hydrolase n=1 Tax=Miltoncostaea marina TaxID=2843215 RepID=UPI001C3C663B|nr:M20/M25/M40 family metallo-hydrolase [Miltoncostaea marina]